MIKSQLQKHILQGDFEQASQLVTGTSMFELEGILLEIAYDSESVSVYNFLCHLIEKHETGALHSIASTLMSNPLCFISGAYAKGFYHAKRAIELEPEDVTLKELILFYSLLPDQLVTKDEANEYAKQILLTAPKNKTALDFLNNK
ncbi:hypothetical protein IDH44_07220 [Paenibacillus sp. IB182496]|uniref:Uncharacterized protein n=1 Tax=Paenibacillus sabuli TaxID=2772509 RepID=A0A927BSP7_9BACL|nr:hypothetical protein [Paenibacillus sabuli]MBD2844975.1 hypothetical protein [Paenibacillus sabuli]